VGFTSKPKLVFCFIFLRRPDFLFFKKKFCCAETALVARIINVSSKGKNFIVAGIIALQRFMYQQFTFGLKNN
jgi:hypothetical protein